MEQLNFKRLVCTRPKTKFNPYLSFRVSLTEENFPIINNTVAWPNCLIAPFNRKFSTAEAHFYSAAPVSEQAVILSCCCKAIQ